MTAIEGMFLNRDLGMTRGFKKLAVVFHCHNTGYKKERLKELLPPSPGVSIRFVGLPCSGKIEVQFLLKTFETGVDAIFILGCLDGTCHYVEGNRKTRGRVQYVKDILNEIGIGGDRLEMFQISSDCHEGVREVMARITETVNEVSFSPLK
jgi:F420-non-reducing hydrogenase iron-sulfur subunit